MKLLLDTHILLWSLYGNGDIPKDVWHMIGDTSNDVYYSTASIWEITIKHMAKPEKMLLSGTELAEKCNTVGFQMLAITDNHVGYLETLCRKTNAKPHNDPFDRIMIAQAKAEKMTFITHDSLMSSYEEPCILPI